MTEPAYRQAWYDCSSIDVRRPQHRCAAGLNNLLTSPLYVGDGSSPPRLNSCEIRNFLQVPGGTATHKEYPGRCEHQKNTFLQWHRAQLYYYEKALQAADPEGQYGPSTKDVALPYWNFTQPPSGQRYPQAFENPDSPLFDSARTTEPHPKPAASPELLASFIYNLDWPAFGGDEYGTNGGGAIETRMHNGLHFGYINGHMIDNTTAAMDPIFFVFHNFIDYILEKWIQTHDQEQITGTGRDNYMRAEQDDHLLKPVGFDEGSGDPKRDDSGDYTRNMGQAKIYFDTQQQGYAFAGTDEFLPPAKIRTLIDRHQPAGFVFGDNPMSLYSALLGNASLSPGAPFKIKLSGTYEIPDKTIDEQSARATLSFSRKSVNPNYSFHADVYLYPEDIKGEIDREDFRNRYLVTNRAHWGLSHHSDYTLNFKEHLTGIINSLVDKKQGEKWNITVAISGKSESMNIDQFTPPSIQIEATQ